MYKTLLVVFSLFVVLGYLGSLALTKMNFLVMFAIVIVLGSLAVLAFSRTVPNDKERDN